MATGKEKAMDQIAQKGRQKREIPIAGVLLAVLFTIDVFFVSFYQIVQTCGGIVFGFYKLIAILLAFSHFFFGLLVIPVLLVMFIVQAVRRRRNRGYIRNCALSILWCLIVFLAGRFIGCLSPAIERVIVDLKIQGYQSTIDRIHSGEQMTKYVDMTGGINGGEDVAFFQYSTGESKEDDGQFYMTHIYIIYSEDTSCDVEAIKEHAKGSPLYDLSEMEMLEIKENWYQLTATYWLNP